MQIVLSLFEVIFILAVSAQVFGKAANPVATPTPYPLPNFQKILEDAKNGAVYPGQKAGRRSRRDSAEAARHIKRAMEPDVAVEKEFSELLDSLDARLVRLHPDFGCEAKYTLSVDANCAERVMGASRYEGLHYDNGRLVGDSFFTLFMLADGGEVDFQNLNLRHRKVKLVSDLEVPITLSGTRTLYENLARHGVTVDDLHISDRIEASEGRTFVVRAVAYKVTGLKYFNPSATQIPPQFVARSFRGWYDVTIAAKIVRRFEDGVIHLLWRPIARKSPPKIRFAKGEIPTDFRDKRE